MRRVAVGVGVVAVLMMSVARADDLVSAAGRGDLKTVDGFISQGVDVNARRNDSETALEQAAAAGHNVVVETLLAHGADVNAKDNKGDTALIDAACEYKDVVATLLAHGADVNTRGYIGTALECAARNGHNDVVQTLLAHGADVNAKDGVGGTALIAATEYGHTDIVEMLLAHGADVNAENDNGYSALKSAAQNGHTDIVDMLLAHGADVNSIVAKAPLEDTALGYAAASGHKDIVDTLLAHGADMNAKNGIGQTAFEEAAYSGQNSVVETLIAHGVDVNAKDSIGETALQWAAGQGHNHVVATLIDHGADVNAKASAGETALWSAAAQGYNDVVVTLLAHGADVNTRVNDSGETALAVAAEYGHRDVVETLLFYGADVNLGRQAGTAIQMAALSKHPDIIKVLKEEPDKMLRLQSAALAKITLRKAHSPRAALATILDKLKMHPNEEVLLQAAIQVAARVRPAPNVPSAARKHLARGVAAFGLAKTRNDYQSAIDEFQQASNLAPWWPDPYYNLAKTQQRTGAFAAAAVNFRSYLAAAPRASDRKQVRMALYKAQYLATHAAAAPPALADSGVLALACADNAGTDVKHVWINLSTGAVSDDRVNSAAPSYGVTISPATITPTRIQYSSYWPPAAMTWTVVIDRTTGVLTESNSHLGQVFNTYTYACVKSTTSLPATRF